jgi:hypothetical protein
MAALRPIYLLVNRQIYAMSPMNINLHSSVTDECNLNIFVGTDEFKATDE